MWVPDFVGRRRPVGCFRVSLSARGWGRCRADERNVREESYFEEFIYFWNIDAVVEQEAKLEARPTYLQRLCVPGMPG